jgi:voltage-gated potassium channel
MTNEDRKSWRSRLHEIIYESNTAAGKAFDITLLLFIFTSILVVMLDSVERWHNLYGRTFFILEWVFTFFFTIEYVLRLICIRRPLRYVFSFFGIIDLLAIIPSYLSIFLWVPNRCSY